MIGFGDKKIEELTYRDEHGVMIAKLDSVYVLNKVIPSSTGEVIEKTITTQKGLFNVKRFIFDEDMVFRLENLGKIYFWKNSYIELRRESVL